MRLDPLGGAREQLHLGFVFVFLLLDEVLNFLGFSAFFAAVVPLVQQGAELVLLLLVLLFEGVQVLVRVSKLGVVGVEGFGVHLVSGLELSGQLRFLHSVGFFLGVQGFFEIVDLLLQVFLVGFMLLQVLLVGLDAFIFKLSDHFGLLGRFLHLVLL